MKESRNRQSTLSAADGSVAIEFAMIAPILFMLLLGTMEVAQILSANSALSRAVRDGARFAMVRGAASEVPATKQDIKDTVKASAFMLDPTLITVTVNYDPNSNPGSKVSVQGSYTFNFAVPFLGHYPINLTGYAESTIHN